MSVLARKRKTSHLKAYDFAVMLRRDIMLSMLNQFCNEDLYRQKVITEKGTEVKTEEKYPKYAVDNLRNNIMSILFDITKFISKANAIYPTTIEELKRRDELQRYAIESIANLMTELNCISTIFEDQISLFLPFADRVGELTSIVKKWRKSNKNFEDKIEKANKQE